MIDSLLILKKSIGDHMMKLSHSCCKSSWRRVMALLLVVAMLQLSAVRPVMAFSVGEERQVGEILLCQIRKEFTLLDDPDIAQYFNDLGHQILLVAGAQYFNYHFFVIKNQEFNAFAAPSGLIFFHTGLVETMDSEDELVSVMAHEIGHVVSRHIASQMDKGMKVGLGALALAIAGMALGAGAASQALVTGSMAANQALSLHFSRQNEEEADLLSYGWMKKMQRNPKAMEKMLNAMRRITRYRMGDVPQYLLTHPDPEARLGYIQSLMAVDGKAVLDGFKPTDNFDFLRVKYRILSQVEDDGKFRNYLVSRISASNLTKLEQSMAKYGLSQVEHEASNYERSRALLQEVIAEIPDRPILLVDLARAELALGKKEKAVELLQRAHQLNPDDLWAIFQLASIYLDNDKLRDAEEYLFTVAGAIPEYAKVYYELGSLRAKQGKKVESSYYLAKYYLFEGRIKLAKKSLEKLVEQRMLPAQLHQDADAMLDTIYLVENGPGSTRDKDDTKKREEEQKEREAARRERPW